MSADDENDHQAKEIALPGIARPEVGIGGGQCKGHLARTGRSNECSGCIAAGFLLPFTKLSQAELSHIGFGIIGTDQTVN
jgi:hypothetical protein